MAWYIAKMLLLLPILALLIWASLKLTQRMQKHLTGRVGEERKVRLVETCFLGPGIKLAVVEFRGREILLGCSRQGLTRLSEAPVTVNPHAEQENRP